MSDDQVGREWVSVSSGTGLPGLTRTTVCVCVCVCVFTCISTELWHFVIILPYYVLSSFTEIRGDRPYLVEVSTCAAVFLCFSISCFIKQVFSE